MYAVETLKGEEQDLWPFIASIIYTAAWSVSFYGQIYENYKLKSVEGFELNYLVMNICGYTLYGIYSTIGYFTSISGAGTVVFADIFFVYHAIVMVIIQSLQVLYYPRGKNRVSGFTIILCVSIWIFVIGEAFLTELGVIEWTELWNPVSCLGYGKLVFSFVKYSPAVYWNYKRKSTKGWSIFNIILDLVGASFSMASGSLSISNGLNITKLALAILTIFYDLIFVVQHYILYRPKKNQNTLSQTTYEKLRE